MIQKSRCAFLQQLTDFDGGGTCTVASRCMALSHTAHTTGSASKVVSGGAPTGGCWRSRPQTALQEFQLWTKTV